MWVNIDYFILLKNIGILMIALRIKRENVGCKLITMPSENESK